MFTRFAADRRGAVALLFAFVLIPLLAVVGVAVDYGRSARIRADLQAAVDGAALAAGKNAIEQQRKDLARVARNAFDAAFRPDSGTTVTKFELAQNARRIAVEAHVSLPTMFGAFVGQRAVALMARAEVPAAGRSVDLALVLDNTGSMGQLGKMGALKEAAANLVATIQASRGSINSRIALVPFNTQVNVGEENRGAPWVRFELPGQGTGKGWNGSGGSPGPSPGMQGALTGVLAALWKGCVADRDQPYDAQATPPVPSRPETLHPAAICQYPGLQKAMPLTRDFLAVRQAIDQMAPTGNTNTGIGLAWGLSVLTAGSPLGGPPRPPPEGLERTIVFLTDGENTQNRWTTNRTEIDKRTEAMCDEIRSQGVKLYAIRVIEGNEGLLRKCATQPSMYFSVSRASELREVFDRIAVDLTTLRLSF